MLHARATRVGASSDTPIERFEVVDFQPELTQRFRSKDVARSKPSKRVNPVVVAALTHCLSAGVSATSTAQAHPSGERR